MRRENPNLTQLAYICLLLDAGLSSLYWKHPRSGFSESILYVIVIHSLSAALAIYGVPFTRRRKTRREVVVP